MTQPYGPKGLMEVVEGKRVPPNCDLTLQITPVFAEDGVARGEWTIDDKFVNGVGVCMGGYLAAAADTMMAYAISSKLNDGRTFSTIHLHTTFHRPAFVGPAEVEAHVKRMGRSIAYLAADVRQNGRSVMEAVSSLMLAPMPDETQTQTPTETETGR